MARRTAALCLLLALAPGGCGPAGRGAADPPAEPDGPRAEPGPAEPHVESQTRSLEVAGTPVHLVEARPAAAGGAPLVLLLHGGRFSSADWVALGTPERLARAGWRAVAPDLPGFGRSPASALRREEFLAHLLDALEVERAVVVAPSMSGGFALPLLARHPERVRALVALAPVGIERWAPELDRLEVPALLAWGADDRTVPLADAGALAARLPGAERYVLEGGAHAWYFAHPAAFHAELERFLAALPRG